MSATRPIARFGALLMAAVVLGAFAALPAAASAATPAPAWNLRVMSVPTNLVPGSGPSSPIRPLIEVIAHNVGEAPADGPVTISATLPVGLTPIGEGCPVVGRTITCTFTGTRQPGRFAWLEFNVEVDALPDPTVLGPIEATVSSPGAAPVSTAGGPVTVSAEEPPFGLLEGGAGFFGTLSEADGSPATAAGSHPGQLTVNLGFPTKLANVGKGATNFLGAGGGVRDIRTYLPKGLVIDPSATPVRCTEAGLQSRTCSQSSALGKAHVLFGNGGLLLASDTLFNLEPPPGAAAEFGFEVLDSGLFVHVLGGVRAGDYALMGAANHIPALFNHPVYASQLHIWGDPSASSHDYVRSLTCQEFGIACSVPDQDTPVLSLPTSCAAPLELEAEVDGWKEPGDWLTRSVPFTDLDGNPADTVSGCNAVPFKPTLSVQPTTNLTDSPSGLNVDLEIPQSTSLATTATAHLKAATVTLPEGLVVNPSSANGLEACTPAQIGIDPETGIADGNPAACPDASKIGSVEVESPLLAQYDEENKVQRDPQGHVIAEPISGSVYLASPHDNPFDSLLAIYIALHDPRHGIVVKLAGQVQADPATGRLTTTFANNPQLPFERFKLKFFGGAGAALRTPLTCGTKTTASTLTPWSSPEGQDETPTDSFQSTAVPGGGACPQSEGAAANAPAFSAGTISPQAAAYSPFVLKLSREDGSQPIAAIDTTLPPGLTGKLAGISYCPEGALADAAAKSGNAEKQSPSCPTSSEVGSVVVGAGAGPTPYYTQGKAYLAGPYKGAPLSLAIVTPATAGPYDLGTVVVRTALNVDPETARIRAVSDPIPQILQGIPLDVRSIALRMDRPQFTLNPTSCDPMVLSGSAISPFGSAAALTSPFQVGGCQALPFKPKLAIRLSGGTKRGGHPALRAVLTAKPGEANIAKTVVALPKSEFLEQAHIKTICTRVQFAANACPAGSIYGKATAITPLLEQPLSGPVYMRSSSNPLPDLVADLNGQIHVALVGRIDSVKGGIRTSFESIPDAPVTKFVLRMQGGEKGLLVNSRDICKGTHRASVQMDGQNGKAYDTRPKLKAKCPKGKRKSGVPRGR